MTARYQSAALDSVERKTKRHISKHSLVDCKLQNLDHRRKTYFSVFSRIHFGKHTQEFYNLVPLSQFFFRSSRKYGTQNAFVIDIPYIGTKRFTSSFLKPIAKKGNTLLVSRCKFSENLLVSLGPFIIVKNSSSSAKTTSAIDHLNR